MTEPSRFNKSLADLMAELRSMPEHTCRICGGKFVGIPAPNCFDCDQAEIARTDLERKQLADLSAVDRRFAAATLGGYACPPGDPAALAAVRRWQPPEGLYLFGRPGCGKSHLAFARARELITESGRRVFASEWTALLHRMRASFDGKPGGETAAEIRAAMARADVLLIDDLLTGKVTEWAVEVCWSIVQERYQAQTPLVLTANYSLGELSKRIGGIDGERIASRLAEMCQRVKVEAPDYRVADDGRTA